MGAHWGAWHNHWPQFLHLENGANICADLFPGVVPLRAAGELDGKCCHRVFRVLHTCLSYSS